MKGITVHAAYEPSTLLLWAEDGGDRRPGRGAVPRHPGALERGELEDLLGAIGAPGGDIVERVAWLPTLEGRPLPSSRAHRGELALAPWRVQAARLPGEALPSFLLRLRGRDILAPHVRAGRSLLFFVEGLHAALTLVARTAFRPAVVRGARGFEARFLPLPVAEEAAFVESLARRLPDASRALSPSHEAPPTTPRREILRAFLGDVTDPLVRSAGASPRRAHALATLHDLWCAHLVSSDPVLPGREEELSSLARASEDWARPLVERSLRPYRLCLRLEEPAAEGPWWVSFLLQSSADPSLLVPAEAVWARDEVTTQALPGGEAALLALIGEAAALSPSVAATLGAREPVGFALTTEDVVRFVAEEAWLLAEGGVGVLLPSWWGRRDRLTVRARLSARGKTVQAGLGLDSLVDVAWGVALGDEELSQEELEQLAALKTPLVRLRGQWVHVQADEIAALLAKLKARPRATVRDLLRLAGDDSTAELRLEGEGALTSLLDILAGVRMPAPKELPKSLAADLRPYQRTGYDWLNELRSFGLGACLADDMGLGKTVQTLAVLLSAWEREGPAPSLLLCPTSVLENWRKEAERFTPALPVLLHHGPNRLQGDAFLAAAEKVGLVVTSYALLARDQELFRRLTWRAVVLDEAQYVKNADTKTARAARTLKAGFRLALTGTPVENSLEDLWSIMEFLNPGLLGSRADFRRRFSIPIQIEGDEAAKERLRRLSAPFILRRLKTDPTVIQDLPEKIEVKEYCTLTREQASLYQAVLLELEQALQEKEGIERRGLVLAALTHLKEICNHPAHFLKDHSPLAGRSGKLLRLEEMVAEVLAAGERALIFTQFQRFGERLAEHLEARFGREVLFLHGGVRREEREEMVARFSEPDGPMLFLLTVRAGGTGLNLTAANHVLHVDRWWNPAVEEQATDRAFRIGQKRNVLVHKFICAGTLEERVDALLERKKALAEDIVGRGETWLTELPDEELRALVALDPEVVVE